MQENSAPPSSRAGSGAPGVGGLSGSMVASLSATRPWVLVIGIVGLVFATLGAIGLLVSVWTLAVAGASVGGFMPIGQGALMSLELVWLAGYFILVCVHLSLSLRLVRYGSAIGRFIQSGSVAEAERALEMQAGFFRLMGILVVIGVCVGLGLPFILGALGRLLMGDPITPSWTPNPPSRTSTRAPDGLQGTPPIVSYGSSDVEPDRMEAKRPVPKSVDNIVKPRIVEGAIEGEKATVLERTGGTTEIQESRKFNWSRNAQLWWRDGEVGDTLTLEFEMDKAGEYDVTLGITKAIDYGICKIDINGETRAPAADFFNNGVIAGDLKLGKCKLFKGKNKLRVTITGSNPSARVRHMFGLDYILPAR